MSLAGREAVLGAVVVLLLVLAALRARTEMTSPIPARWRDGTVEWPPAECDGRILLRPLPDGQPAPCPRAARTWAGAGSDAMAARRSLHRSVLLRAISALGLPPPIPAALEGAVAALEAVPGALRTGGGPKGRPDSGLAAAFRAIGLDPRGDVADRLPRLVFLREGYPILVLGKAEGVVHAFDPAYGEVLLGTPEFHRLRGGGVATSLAVVADDGDAP